MPLPSGRFRSSRQSGAGSFEKLGGLANGRGRESLVSVIVKEFQEAAAEGGVVFHQQDQAALLSHFGCPWLVSSQRGVRNVDAISNCTVGRPAWRGSQRECANDGASLTLLCHGGERWHRFKSLHEDVNAGGGVACSLQ